MSAAAAAAAAIPPSLLPNAPPPPSPPPPKAPRFRVMEVAAQKGDMVYKCDAEGEELFLPPESYGPGIAKLPPWQTVTLIHL